MLDGYMTLEQFCQLVEFINFNHAWGVSRGKWVKYIIPSYDTRTQMIYGIKLRGMFEDKDFFIVNEDVHRNLNQWVREWLES